MKMNDCIGQYLLCQRYFNPYVNVISIKAKRTSRAIIRIYSNIGSPWRAPLFNVKYWVAKPQFITQDCWSFKNILIQLIKLPPKKNLFKKHNKISWSKEPKAF